MLDVGVDELDAHPIADVKALEAAHDLSLHGRLEDADPRTLLGRASHDRVKLLADPRCEKLCGGGLSHLPLNLGRIVLLVGEYLASVDRRRTLRTECELSGVVTVASSTAPLAGDPGVPGYREVPSPGASA